MSIVGRPAFDATPARLNIPWASHLPLQMRVNFSPIRYRLTPTSEVSRKIGFKLRPRESRGMGRDSCLMDGIYGKKRKIGRAIRGDVAGSEVYGFTASRY